MVNHSKKVRSPSILKVFSAPCFIEQCKNGEGGSGKLAFDDMMSGAGVSIVFVVGSVMEEECTVSCCEGGREFFRSTAICHF